MTKKYITKKELAEMLSVAPNTVSDWVYDRKVPYLKINGAVRFDVDQITRWIESKERKPKKAIA